MLPQLYAILVGSLPLAIVAGAAIGAVVWMHTFPVLERFGSTDELPSYFAVALLLELSPVAAGLIVAARTGASLGAELGAMRINEQLDALEMLGVSGWRQLIGPRVLACMLALPLLHVLTALAAILSGYIVHSGLQGVGWSAYRAALLRELSLADVVPAGLKTIVFGYLIAVAGCFHGTRAEGGTEGVGQAAMHGVVLASLWVLLADVFLVGLIRVFQQG